MVNVRFVPAARVAAFDESPPPISARGGRTQQRGFTTQSITSLWQGALLCLGLFMAFSTVQAENNTPVVLPQGVDSSISSVSTPTPDPSPQDSASQSPQTALVEFPVEVVDQQGNPLTVSPISQTIDSRTPIELIIGLRAKDRGYFNRNWIFVSTRRLGEASTNVNSQPLSRYWTRPSALVDLTIPSKFDGIKYDVLKYTGTNLEQGVYEVVYNLTMTKTEAGRCASAKNTLSNSVNECFSKEIVITFTVTDPVLSVLKTSSPKTEIRVVEGRGFVFPVKLFASKKDVTLTQVDPSTTLRNGSGDELEVLIAAKSLRTLKPGDWNDLEFSASSEKTTVRPGVYSGKFQVFGKTERRATAASYTLEIQVTVAANPVVAAANRKGQLAMHERGNRFLPYFWNSKSQNPIQGTLILKNESKWVVGYKGRTVMARLSRTEEDLKRNAEFNLIFDTDFAFDERLSEKAIGYKSDEVKVPPGLYTGILELPFDDASPSPRIPITLQVRESFGPVLLLFAVGLGFRLLSGVVIYLIKPSNPKTQEVAFAILRVIEANKTLKDPGDITHMLRHESSLITYKDAEPKWVLALSNNLLTSILKLNTYSHSLASGTVTPEQRQIINDFRNRVHTFTAVPNELIFPKPKKDSTRDLVAFVSFLLSLGIGVIALYQLYEPNNTFGANFTDYLSAFGIGFGAMSIPLSSIPDVLQKMIGK